MQNIEVVYIINSGDSFTIHLKRKGISSGGWDNPIGIWHRIRILKIISRSSASGVGITVAEISKQSRLSRQTAYSWVNELLEEGSIAKVRNQYFIKEDMADNYWITLAGYLEYLLICRRVSRFRVEPIQFNSLNRDANDLEGAVLRIANCLGAFITFVLIEAMRPSKKIISPTNRARMSLDFIKSSMPLDDLFGTFINLLPDSLSNDIFQGIQLKKASHDRLSRAFRHVYPSIYKALLDGFNEYSDLLDSYPSSETKNEKM